VCGSFTVREAAKDLGLPPSADEFEVAEAYSKGMQSDHQQPAFEGCLAGYGIGG
jgi:hypothetical protein